MAPIAGDVDGGHALYMLFLWIGCLSLDTGGTRTVVSEMSAPGVAPGACGALVAPWLIDDAEDAAAAMAWMPPDPTGPARVWEEMSEHFSEEGCPTWAGASGGHTLFGDCTTSTGVAWSGEGTVDTAAGGERRMDVFRWTWKDFHFALPDGTLDVSLDGSVSDAIPSGEGPRLEQANSLWMRVQFTGYYDLPKGEWYRHQLVVIDATPSVDAASTFSSYVYVLEDPAGGPTGDACHAWTLRLSESCDAEPDGRVEVVGTSEAVFTFDGSSACDGCAGVTLDGVDAGTWCGELPRF